jgi:hypothetical protein
MVAITEFRLPDHLRLHNDYNSISAYDLAGSQMRMANQPIEEI